MSCCSIGRCLNIIYIYIYMVIFQYLSHLVAPTDWRFVICRLGTFFSMVVSLWENCVIVLLSSHDSGGDSGSLFHPSGWPAVYHVWFKVFSYGYIIKSQGILWKKICFLIINLSVFRLRFYLEFFKVLKFVVKDFKSDFYLQTYHWTFLKLHNNIHHIFKNITTIFSEIINFYVTIFSLFGECRLWILLQIVPSLFITVFLYHFWELCLYLSSPTTLAFVMVYSDWWMQALIGFTCLLI